MRWSDLRYQLQEKSSELTITWVSNCLIGLILILTMWIMYPDPAFAIVEVLPGDPPVCDADDGISGGQASDVNLDNRVIRSRGEGQAFGQENSSFSQIRIGFIPTISFPATVEAGVQYNGLLRGFGGGNNNRGRVRLELSLREFDGLNEGEVIDSVVLLDEEEDGSPGQGISRLISSNFADTPTSATFDVDLEAGQLYGVVLRIETTGSGGDGTLIAHGLADFLSGNRSASLGCVSITPNLQDSDDDGLYDIWEEEGIDLGDGVIFNLPGSDPLHKNIYVEADFTTGQSPEPVPQVPEADDALDLVIKAFAEAPVDNPDGNRGINLFIERDDQINNDGEGIVFGVSGFDPTVDFPSLDFFFDNIKRDFFGSQSQREDINSEKILTAKKLAYHYALFAQSICGQGDFDDDGQPFCSASAPLGGEAEVFGDDLIVAKGSILGPKRQAGTFMHELGHNLDLRHGGNVETGCKPNYLSIMNYMFQPWIPNADPALRFGGRLDYSRQALDSLDESSLDELAGIGLESVGQNGENTDYTFWSVDSLSVLTERGDRPIDWNDNDVIESNVIQDLNRFPANGCEAGDGTTLEGYDDWSNLRYNFRESSNFPETMRLEITDEELTDEDYLKIEDFWNRFTDLEIAKNAFADTDIAVAGQEIVYTLTVQNNGPHLAQDVQVTDILPPQVTYVSDTGNCIENPEGELTCNLGELSVGESMEFDIIAHISADLPWAEEQFTTIANNARVENLAGSDLDSTNNQITERTQVLCIKYEYSAKLICGKQNQPEDLRLARGLYATAVNIHNPNDQQVYFFKKLALTYPPEEQKPGQVIPIAVDTLQYDEALAVDCLDIQNEAFTDQFPESYIKGFVVIQSPKSLDVTAVYTAASLDKKGRVKEQSSIDVEQVRERIREQAQEIDLSVKKEANVVFNGAAGLNAFNVLSYTVEVTNNGSSTAQNITVKDIVKVDTPSIIGDPGDFTLINLTGDTAELEAIIPVLQASETKTLQFVAANVVFVRDPFGGQEVTSNFTNTATVSSSVPDVHPENNSTTVVTSVTAKFGS